MTRSDMLAELRAALRAWDRARAAWARDRTSATLSARSSAAHMRYCDLAEQCRRDDPEAWRAFVVEPR